MIKRRAFLLALILPACLATRTDLKELQRQTVQIERDMKNTLSGLGVKTEEIKTTTERLDDLHAKLRESFADTNSRIEALDRRIGKLSGELTEHAKFSDEKHLSAKQELEAHRELLRKESAELASLRSDSAVLRRDLAAFSVITGFINNPAKMFKNATPEKRTFGKNEKDAMYQYALKLLNDGRINDSRDAFEGFIAMFPKEPLTGNALYWLGEGYYAQKRYREALSYFHQVVTDFSNGNKVAAALLKEGMALRELGLTKEGNAAISELIARFPYSEEALSAKKHKQGE